MSTSPESEDHYYAALDLMAQGEPAAAVPRLQQALAIAPDFFDAMHALIRALQDSGDYDRAVSVAHDLIARDSDDILAHTSLSILYQRKGMVPEAEAEAAKARLLGWKHHLRQSRVSATPE